MARLDTPELWVARIQEQLAGLARADKMLVSLDTGDPVPADKGERVFISKEAFFAGDTLTIRHEYTYDLEK